MEGWKNWGLIQQQRQDICLFYFEDVWKNHLGCVFKLKIPGTSVPPTIDGLSREFQEEPGKLYWKKHPRDSNINGARTVHLETLVQKEAT